MSEGSVPRRFRVEKVNGRRVPCEASKGSTGSDRRHLRVHHLASRCTSRSTAPEEDEAGK